MTNRGWSLSLNCFIYSLEIWIKYSMSFLSMCQCVSFELSKVFDTIGPSGCVSLWPYLMHFYVINFLFVLHAFKLESLLPNILSGQAFLLRSRFVIPKSEWMMSFQWNENTLFVERDSDTTLRYANFVHTSFLTIIVALLNKKMCNLLLIWWSISQWGDLKNNNPFISYKRISKRTRCQFQSKI